MTNADLPSAITRQQVYALLITVAAGLCLGRIMLVERWWGDNDGSRWLTAQALATTGSYVIGERIEYPNGEYLDRGLLFKDGKARSNDVVLSPTPVWENADARGSMPARIKRFYSSKPTLLPTLMGGLTRLVERVTPWTLEESPGPVIRIGLVVFNWLPFVLMLLALTGLIEQYGRTDWGRCFAVAAACFGTFVTSFQTSINNHTVAAAAISFALYFMLRPAGPNQLHAFIAGFWAGFAAANELPAMAFIGLVLLDLVLRGQWRYVPMFAVAAALPIAGEAMLNWLALGTSVPAYAKVGTEWYTFPGSYWANKKEIDAAADPMLVYLAHLLVGHHGLFSLTPVFILGLVEMIKSWQADAAMPEGLRRIGRIGSVTAVVVVGFYVFTTNNYGGWTLGPRWLFWLTPFFILLMLPWLDQAATVRPRRNFATFLLGWSAFSVFYMGLNPWYHPWLFWLCHSCGLIPYK